MRTIQPLKVQKTSMSSSWLPDDEAYGAETAEETLDVSGSPLGVAASNCTVDAFDASDNCDCDQAESVPHTRAACAAPCFTQSGHNAQSAKTSCTRAFSIDGYSTEADRTRCSFPARPVATHSIAVSTKTIPIHGVLLTCSLPLLKKRTRVTTTRVTG